VAEFPRWRRANLSTATAYQDGFGLRRFVRQVGERQLRHLTSAVVQDWFVVLTEPHRGADGLAATGRAVDLQRPATRHLVAV
jgi:hypothetical protein